MIIIQSVNNNQHRSANLQGHWKVAALGNWTSPSIVRIKAQESVIYKPGHASKLPYALVTYNLKNRLARLTVVIAMRTTVTKRAQTVVPAEIHVRYGIKGGDLLESIDEERA